MMRKSHAATLPLAATAALALLIGCTSSPEEAGTTSSSTTSSASTTVSSGASTSGPASPASATGTVETTSTEPDVVTPIVLAAIGDALVVDGSDGMQHIDYDLLITNVFTAAVTLTSVQVLDESGAPVLTLEGDALAAGLTEQNFIQHEVDPPSQIPVSAQVTVEVDVMLPIGVALPSSLDHVIGWSLPTDAPALSILDGKSAGQVTGPQLAVSTNPAVEISAPLEGDGWTSLQGCCLPNGHRSLRYALDGSRETKAEMFAADWVRIQDGVFVTKDGFGSDSWPTNANYTYIGSDLLAVSDGTVVKTRDGLPNETPMQPPQNVKVSQDYIGNSVVIQIAPDRYAIYGHINTGTVAVKVGDTVKAGDVIGKLGNTGNSTAAHLHFVVTDGPDFLTSTSIPFVIKDWTLQGTVTADQLNTPPGPDGPVQITVAGPTVPQTDTHPLYLSVADFG